MRLVDKESRVIVRVSDDYAASLLAGGRFIEAPTAEEPASHETRSNDPAPRRRRTSRS